MPLKSASLCFRGEEEAREDTQTDGEIERESDAFPGVQTRRRQVICRRDGDERCHCVICQPYLFIGRTLSTRLIRGNHLICSPLLISSSLFTVPPSHLISPPEKGWISQRKTAETRAVREESVAAASSAVVIIILDVDDKDFIKVLH